MYAVSVGSYMNRARLHSHSAINPHLYLICEAKIHILEFVSLGEIRTLAHMRFLEGGGLEPVWVWGWAAQLFLKVGGGC